MNQQESQFDIVDDTREDKQIKKKEKRRVFLGGMTWGFFIGGIFTCLCILSIRGYFYFQNRNALQIPESTEQSTSANENTGTSITEATIQKLKTLESAIDVYYYQEDLDYEAMQNGLFSGLVDSLGDPYSAYYTKEEFEKVTEDNTGVYYGIGAYVSFDADYSMPKIAGIIADTPAEAAGLRENDLITAVGEISTYQMSTDEVVTYIRGEEGTYVDLTIYREGETDYLHFTVERKRVESPTVNSKMIGEVGYIQITQFEEVTVNQFQEAYESLKTQGMKGLVLDLRSNPGGLLSSVIEIARQILPEGLIVYTEDKYGQREKFTCDGANEIDIPLAVLINGNSASASEILAGAVKDYGIGTLVGTTTYGKGVVQNIFGLSDGSAIKLTISNYFTPNGNNIHGIGIEPDVEVELDVDKYYDEEIDTQLEKALEIVNSEIAQ